MPPRRCALFVAAIALTSMLAACGPRDATYDTSAFQIHGTIAPPDVAVPSNRGIGSSEFNGLYLEGPDSFSCCWIAPRASLLIRKRARATDLVIGLRLPNLPRFAGGQIVTIRIGTDATPHRISLAAGEQLTDRLPLSGQLRDATGLIPVDVTAAVAYVPSRDTPPSHSLLSLLHLRAAAPSSDTRQLAVIVLYSYFQ